MKLGIFIYTSLIFQMSSRQENETKLNHIRASFAKLCGLVFLTWYYAEQWILEVLQCGFSRNLAVPPVSKNCSSVITAPSLQTEKSTSKGNLQM